MIALGFAVNVALEAALRKLLLDLRRSVGAVGPDPGGRVALIENIVQRLAVMGRGRGDRPAPHQLVATVDANMVLVAVMAAVVLLGPTCVPVLLAQLCWLFLPFGRCLTL